MINYLPYAFVGMAEANGRLSGFIRFHDRDNLSPAECRLLSDQLKVIAEFLEAQQKIPPQTEFRK